MPAVDLDLAPVVERLLSAPYDYAALQQAHAAVGGHPQAYATALRIAAKRIADSVAAAHWLIEAARVHESVDDLGGAIALMARAWDCDPGNARTRELLAGYLARLSARVGLGVVSGVEPQSLPMAPPTEPMHAGATAYSAESADSGLRRVEVQKSGRPRLDTLPGVGAEAPSSASAPDTAVQATSLEAPPADADAEAPAADADAAPESTPPVTLPSEPPRTAAPALDATRVEAPAPVSPPEPVEAPVERTAAEPREPSMVSLIAIDFDPDDTPPPPSSPGVVDLTDAAVIEETPSFDDADDDGPSLEAFANTLWTSRSERAEPQAKELSRPGWTESVLDDVYGDPNGPPTDRPSGDTLVGMLFEALHQLHFLDDAYDGAEFVLKVVAETTHASAALVHLYDINNREFVVVSAIGTRAEALVEWVTPEDDPLVAEVMAGEEATVVLEPDRDPRLSRGRWVLVEPRRAVLCAPAAIDGRYLGLLEIADPTDGSEFTENDRNALTYVATRLAGFLAERGVIFSEPPPDYPAESAAIEQASSP